VTAVAAEKSPKTAQRKEDIATKLSEFLETLREKFYAELAAKTGWGREELKIAFERAISDALAQNTTLQ
jgi:hypothetical protein